ncbi:MAG: NAD(P)-dependent oxidoreductase [Acetobacteraceae bacterium]|nr:NAD(P)-dependent oxidoreductase [Acetobacteraceae bacterium]
MPKKTAFIGLGNIGAPMAATLLRTLKSLTVHDLDPARVQTLVAEGATAATSLTHLAQTSQTILLSLPTSQNVEAVLLGHAGIIHHAAPETLIIDLTSGNPAQSKDIAATLAREKIHYIDAGVSGGVAPAQTGTLGIMIGGADQHVARAMPFLEILGKTIVHIGPVGAGHMTKSLNNLLLASNMIAAAEALALAAKSGLDPAKVVAAINGSSGRSWVSEYRIPNFVLKGDFSEQTGMAVTLLVKDVAIACEAAKSSDVTLYIGNLIHQMLIRISHEVGPTAPNTNVIRAIEDWAGVKIRPANDA